MSQSAASRIMMLVIATVALAACGSPEPQVAPPSPPIAEPAPAPAPAPLPPVPSQPYSYGDDPVLDALWDRCDGGDSQACDDLFWDSPLNSEYEQFAEERMQPVLPPALNPMAILDIAWSSELTAQDRRDICDGAEMFGYDVAAALIVDGLEQHLSASDVASWLTTKC